MAPSLRWDIFCRVVDNFGDAGVCWRLARQLAHEHGLAVTLWIDDVATLASIASSISPSLDDQLAERVRVRRFSEAAGSCAPLADVVIEGFGCGLPDAYVATMLAASRPPVWIVLEYLSAEPWIEASHMLPSPHPRLPLKRWFWFPGFTERTGGLIRESDLMRLRDERTKTQPTAPLDPIVASPADRLEISLFCYSNPALAALLSAWADGPTRVNCTIAAGVAHSEIVRWTGSDAPDPGSALTRGQLTLHIEPLVDHQAFDRRLWRSDLNFVRGEDSFVRAQWAAKPLVWHVYPQAEDAHLVKMDAYLLRQETDLPETARMAQRAFWYAWNSGAARATTAAWPAFRDALPALRVNALAWARALSAQEDMTTRLVTFCENRL